MPQEAGEKEARFPITYFDGVNNTVQPTLAKRTELSHAENFRAPQIGVLEKREGQEAYGTNPEGSRFVATANYGLFKFPTESSSQAGVFRISASDEPTQTLFVDVYDQVYVIDSYPDFSLNGVDNTSTTINLFIADYILVTDPPIYLDLDGDTVTAGNQADICHVYALSSDGKWTALADVDAQSMTGGQFDTAIADRKLIFVNGRTKNRLIKKNGTTVITSTDVGDLYNSPHASRVCFYKNRIHLADFNKNGIQYPTSVIRSSYPLGVIALADGDHEAGVTTLNVTDTKYFYSDSGMNTYDIYRGGTFIETVTVSAVNETSLTVGATSNAINSSDELWIAGTYGGEKQFRWVNNPTSTGRDVKQYDTFKLSGGEEDPITLFETVGNVILMGNKYSLATWDDYTLQGMDLNIGCSSPNGSTKLLGTLYFIHHSGVYATTGGVPTLLSRKVARYLEGATKAGIENAAAGVKGLSVFFTIGDVTLYKEDGSLEKTMRDVCLEYSVADQNWYVHTNVSLNEFVNFISDDGVEHLLGAQDFGSYQVMDFLSGFTDDGTEIFARADTQELQLLQEFETFASPLAVLTEVQRGTQTKCFISLDKQDFYALEGEVKKGVSRLKVNAKDPQKEQPVLARKVKLSYRDSSKQRCRISQVTLVYSPTTIDEVNPE